MNYLLTKYPTISRYVLALVLFAIALVLSGIIDSPFLKQYFPYVSAILLLITTWYMYKIDNKTLKELGLKFNSKKILYLPLGIMIGAIALLCAKYFRAWYVGETFVLSDTLNYTALLYAMYAILPTVAVEEFLFRGYLFKKTVSISNVVIANIIFSTLFMLIHVLDESVLQNKGVMFMLIISIPVGHLFFATALLKSKTLYFPIGLHLGNNWATRHLISNTNDGNSVFYIADPVTFETWTPFITSVLILNGCFLLVTFLIWKWDIIFSIKRA